MAYRGFLKPKLRWPMRLGFFCGLALGAMVTLLGHALCAEYQFYNRHLDGPCLFMWDLLVLPAATLRLVRFEVGDPAATNVGEVSPGMLSRIVATNALLAGVAVALASQLLVRRWQARTARGVDYSGPPRPRKAATKATVGWTVLRGFLLGFAST